MGFFTVDEYKIGRRFNSEHGLIEITGRKNNGSYTYSHVDPKTGYLMQGFGGTIASSIPMKDNLENPMVQIIDEVSKNDEDLADDPNDDITSVNEYNTAVVEKGDEPVTPYEVQVPINESLEKTGRALKAVGRYAAVGGVIAGASVGFVMAAPLAGIAVAVAGLLTLGIFNPLGNALRKKAGVFYKKVYRR